MRECIEYHEQHPHGSQIASARWEGGVLDDAYKRAGIVTAEYAKTFYLGTKLMTPEKARAVWAIYVWCRRTDELVDGPNASHITPEVRECRYLCIVLQPIHVGPTRSVLRNALSWRAPLTSACTSHSWVWGLRAAFSHTAGGPTQRKPYRPRIWSLLGCATWLQVRACFAFPALALSAGLALDVGCTGFDHQSRCLC